MRRKGGGLIRISKAISFLCFLTVLFTSSVLPLISPTVAGADSSGPWYEVKESFQAGPDEAGNTGNYTLKIYLHGICAEGGSFGLAYDTGLMTMSAIQGFSPFVPVMGSETGGEANPYVQDDRQEGFHTFLWLAAVAGTDISTPEGMAVTTSGGIDGTVSGGALIAEYRFEMSEEGFAALTDKETAPSIRVKTWTDTPLSKPADPTTSPGSISLANMEGEIWRRDAAEVGGGFYQVVPTIGTGVDEEYKQQDIRFVYTHTGEKTGGTIRSYNPKNPVEVKLYKKSEGGSYETSPQAITLPIWDDMTGDVPTLTGNGIGTGRYTHKVVLSVTSPGIYKVEIQKEGHLSMVFPETDFSTGVASLPAIELIPGDVNSDGKINQGDRVILLAYAHQTLPVPEPPETGVEKSQERKQFERADINGDGKVDLADLNILMHGGYYLQEEGNYQ